MRIFRTLLAATLAAGALPACGGSPIAPAGAPLLGTAGAESLPLGEEAEPPPPPDDGERSGALGSTGVR